MLNCYLCQESFDFRNVYIKHINSQHKVFGHKVLPAKCTVDSCKFIFNSLEYFSKHLKLKHYPS